MLIKQASWVRSWLRSPFSHLKILHFSTIGICSYANAAARTARGLRLRCDSRATSGWCFHCGALAGHSRLDELTKTHTPPQPEIGELYATAHGAVSGFFSKCRKTRVITSVCGTSVLTVVKKVVTQTLVKTVVLTAVGLLVYHFKSSR